jgi:GntR family transcriptional regulator
MLDPIYRRIAEDLQLKIDSGVLPPGSQLPTELELRETYEASRNTIRDAIKSLITRGLVETRPGQGTFVAEHIDPFVTTLSENPETGLGGGEGASYESEVASARRTPKIDFLRVESKLASGVIAAELEIAEGTPAVSRHQQRHIDGTLWSLQTTFYPMRFVVKGASLLLQAADIPEGTVAYLADTIGVKQVGYRDTITIRAPDMNEATLFKLPSDGRISVIEIFRTAFDEQGNPFRLTVTVFPADRNKFIVNNGRVPRRADPVRQRDLSSIKPISSADTG